MSLQDAAELTREMAQMTAADLEEVWKNHTDESIKREFTFEQIRKYVDEHGGMDEVLYTQ